MGARDACDSEVTDRKIREVFLPPFKKAVEAGCATIMTAYGSTDSTPLTSSRKIMHDILRDELGFEGFVITDWDNTMSLMTKQKVAKDMEDVLSRYKDQLRPAIILIPGREGSLGIGRDHIQRAIERAVGADIL